MPPNSPIIQTSRWERKVDDWSSSRFQRPLRCFRRAHWSIDPWMPRGWPRDEFRSWFPELLELPSTIPARWETNYSTIFLQVTAAWKIKWTLNTTHIEVLAGSGLVDSEEVNWASLSCPVCHLDCCSRRLCLWCEADHYWLLNCIFRKDRNALNVSYDSRSSRNKNRNRGVTAARAIRVDFQRFNFELERVMGVWSSLMFALLVVDVLVLNSYCTVLICLTLGETTGKFFLVMWLEKWHQWQKTLKTRG